MHHDYDYLIIGGGMTADSAATAIRAAGDTGTIGILSDESHPPFPRPALSKKLWTDEAFTVANTALETGDKTGASISLDDAVTSVDTSAKQVVAASGDTYGYGRLLLATGGRTNQIDGLAPSERVFYYRTLADYLALEELVRSKPHVVVVGGGYIGSEMAAAMQQQGCRVTVVLPDDRVADHMFPREIADAFTERFTQAGIDVRTGLTVDGGTTHADGVSLQLSDGSTLDADVAVVGLGISPATGFLGGVVDLDDEGAVVVDERLATSAPDVWAAGDVASYPDPILGRRRVEHVDHATTMGATAGRILAGSDEVYDHTPMFYSDVFDIGYEGVGTLDSSMETVVDEVDGDSRAAVVYYLDDEAVRGVLLWKGAGDVEAAKQLLAEGGRPADASELKGRLTV